MFSYRLAVGQLARGARQLDQGFVNQPIELRA